MHFTHFTVKNFKGIEEARLDLLAKPHSRVHTLIGLNESGKTTLLEAINLIEYRDRLDALNLPGYISYDPHELIPISKRSNFNGENPLEAVVKLDPGDRAGIAAELKKVAITLTSISETFVITQTY